MNYFGKNIKGIREFWGMSQEEFGYLVGASRGMIAQYENRGSSPNNEIKTMIEELVQIPIEKLKGELIPREEYPPYDFDIDQLMTELRDRKDNPEWWRARDVLERLRTSRIEKKLILENANITPQIIDAHESQARSGQHLEKHIGDLQEQAKYFSVRADLLALQNADLKREIEKLEKENSELSKRYLDANNDFIEATKESIDLSNRFKNIVYRIKIFGDMLLDMEFKSREDKDSVQRMLHEIVMGLQYKK